MELAFSHKEIVFRLFKRLHKQDKYSGGTGAGLTNVINKAIIVLKKAMDLGPFVKTIEHFINYWINSSELPMKPS